MISYLQAQKCKFPSLYELWYEINSQFMLLFPGFYISGYGFVPFSLVYLNQATFDKTLYDMLLFYYS